MDRREFSALVGVVLSLPITADAQQVKASRIGALLLGNADAESFRTELRQELSKLGYVEGKNVEFDFRSAEGKLDQLPKLAAELVALNADAIIAVFTPCALAAQQATRTIPIVVVVANPLEMGFVASLAHPGGNITGVSLMAAESHGICVELFRDLLPTTRRIGVLGNAADPSSELILNQIRRAGSATGIEIAPVIMVSRQPEVDAAFASMKELGAGAAVIQGSLSTQAVAELAIRHRLPAASVPRSFSEVGGLMSYGAAGPESFRRTAFFVVKILQGLNPGDLPVEQPTKFDLVVNLRSAKALGLTIPESFLLRADEVIE